MALRDARVAATLAGVFARVWGSPYATNHEPRERRVCPSRGVSVPNMWTMGP
ncbi:MAG: hypothetical protein U0325_36505 [Polyangiales bacterium]